MIREIVCALLMIFVVSACESSSPKVFEISGEAMGMPYSIIIKNPSTEEERNKILKIIATTFEEVDEIHNNWNPHSEISRLNDLKAYQKKEISSELEELLILAERAFVVSEGRFDPTVGPAKEAWLSAMNSGMSLDDQEIARLKKITGWRQVHIDQGIFYKESDGIRIDLGGIAKGHCVDLLYKRLSQNGKIPTFVQWSGEIRASGHHPEGRNWKVKIFAPDSCAWKSIAIDLKNASIATSGGYLQSWPIVTQEGRRMTYTHIINPITCYPLEQRGEDIVSFTALGESCAFLDALATAGMVCSSSDEVISWVKSLKSTISPLKIWAFSQDRCLLNDDVNEDVVYSDSDERIAF